MFLDQRTHPCYDLSRHLRRYIWKSHEMGSQKRLRVDGRFMANTVPKGPYIGQSDIVCLTLEFIVFGSER